MGRGEENSISCKTTPRNVEFLPPTRPCGTIAPPVWAAGEPCLSPLADEREPLVLGEHDDAGRAGLVELGAGAGSGDHVVVLLRHRRRDLGAEALGHRLRL